jgi:hypothetical protein
MCILVTPSLRYRQTHLEAFEEFQVIYAIEQKILSPILSLLLDKARSKLGSRR